MGGKNMLKKGITPVPTIAPFSHHYTQDVGPHSIGTMAVASSLNFFPFHVHLYQLHLWVDVSS